jgi:hypothetical protein
MSPPSTLHSTAQKTSKKKKKIQRVNTKNEHVVLSEDELIDHVTSQYIKGKDGGPLLEDNPEETAHALYLKRLRGHPVLVLNADYQVRLLI